MRVLVACEESQVVCKAFRERGHEAYSCDVQECSGGHSEWHIKGDCILVAYTGDWDLMVAHPPCTFLSRVSVQYMSRPGREELQNEAIEFFLALKHAPIARKCLENPFPQKRVRERIGFWTQVIQPYYFGDPHVKTTCLWLYGLPKLQGLEDVALNPHLYKPKPLGYNSRGNPYYFSDMRSGKTKAKQRSKTFHGIARAMAEQWG